MNWIPLIDRQQLDDIKYAKGFSLIFKHSNRCSISMVTRRQLQMDWDMLPENVPFYFLDLLNYRDLSNAVAEIFSVHHESPQLLLIRDGECIYESSHGEISIEDFVEQMNGAVSPEVGESESQ